MRRMSLHSRLRDRLHKRRRRSPIRLLLIAAGASLILAGCGASGSGESMPAFSADELSALPEQDWVTNGGTLFNQRYSPLDQITSSNVYDLKGVWRIHLGSATDAKYSGETQPLVHDGMAICLRVPATSSRWMSRRAKRSGNTKASCSTRSRPCAAAG